MEGMAMSGGMDIGTDELFLLLEIDKKKCALKDQGIMITKSVQEAGICNTPERLKCFKCRKAVSALKE